MSMRSARYAPSGPRRAHTVSDRAGTQRPLGPRRQGGGGLAVARAEAAARRYERSPTDMSVRVGMWSACQSHMKRQCSSNYHASPLPLLPVNRVFTGAIVFSTRTKAWRAEADIMGREHTVPYESCGCALWHVVCSRSTRSLPWPGVSSTLRCRRSSKGQSRNSRQHTKRPSAS